MPGLHTLKLHVMLVGGHPLHLSGCWPVHWSVPLCWQTAAESTSLCATTCQLRARGVCSLTDQINACDTLRACRKSSNFEMESGPPACTPWVLHVPHISPAAFTADVCSLLSRSFISRLAQHLCPHANCSAMMCFGMRGAGTVFCIRICCVCCVNQTPFQACCG